MADMSLTNPDEAGDTNSAGLASRHGTQETDHNASSMGDGARTQAPLSLRWEELMSSDGRMYYADHATRTTSWRRADSGIAEDAPNTQAGLPPAWRALVDNDGRTYYAHHASKTTSFDRPEGRTDGDLQAGWEMLRNPQGVAYFAGHNTRIVTWSGPRENGSGQV
jgi:hypothetical protein